MKAIINVDRYDYHTFAPNCYVLYGGKIEAVGPMASFASLKERPSHVIDGKGALLLPGHVIGHSHIYSAFARGIRMKNFAPRTFTQRLRQYWWPIDRAYDADACFHSARVCGIEYLKSGVTTVFDHHAGGTIRGSLDAIRQGLVEELGLRGLLCFETSDRFDTEDCIRENAAFAAENKGNGRCRGMFGLHASLTLCDETLKKVANARDGVPIHVHVGESAEEEYQSLNLYGMRSAERFAAFGLLDRDALLAHCTNIDEAEAEVIARCGGNVAINPTANLNSNNGVPDCGLLKRHNIPTLIGTDSLGSNVVKEYQNTYYIMQRRLDDRTMTKFNRQDLLACIRHGYDYAGRLLGASLGRIAPGYEADLIVVPYRVTTRIEEENAFSYLMAGVYPHFFPKYVIVGGEAKVENFETVFDEERIFAQSRDCARRIWSNVEGIDT